MTRPVGAPEGVRYVAVAVPVPLPRPLTWSVPPGLEGLCVPGVRVKVPLGTRRVTGWVVGPAVEPEPGIVVRPIEALLDREAQIGEDLLQLALFVAEYYIEPLGETLRGFLSSTLPAWGEPVASLTAAGVMLGTAEIHEREALELLQELGPMPLGRLLAGLSGPGGLAALDRLEERGRIRVANRTGSLYRKGVGLASLDREEARSRIGRSPKGRAVLDLLHEVGRVMLVEEIEQHLGVGSSVISRLEKLGVLRSFTQVERLDLARHRMRTGDASGAELNLVEEQATAVERLLVALETRSYAPFLLHGVTGAGKTEVYLRTIAAVLEQGGGAIVMVPEIGLVPALAQTVRERFGEATAILHSALGASERRQEWLRIRSGEARVVLGPRSAIFAPVRDLRLIVVDEEQDSAYKQDQSPRYHGRDIALVRARAVGAVALLASATPSLESLHNAARGKLEVLRLPRRVGPGCLPETTVVDLRESRWAGRPGEVFFSPQLLEALDDTLKAGDQAVLLRNRRGYAPLLLCRACGEDHRCLDCGLPRTLHRRAGVLRCHYCGSSRPRPTSCEKCGAEALEAIGSGTERVEEGLRELLPEVPLAVLDADVASRPGGVARVLEDFATGRARVLIGTQMVAKGHHFPQVALAAVLAADSYLGFPDFRAVERTWALLTQLAGRAGRGTRPGRFVVQSWHPDHYAIRSVLAGDDERFVAEELRFRRAFAYPPFTRMVALVVAHARREVAEEEARRLGVLLRELGGEGVRLAGPAPAPLERLRGAWRWQILARSTAGTTLRRVVAEAVARLDSRFVTVDVDPLDLS